MTDIERITKELGGKLDPKHIKVRPDSKMSYVEAWFIIEELNRIFGHFGWNIETSYEKVAEQWVASSYEKNEAKKAEREPMPDQWAVGYIAKVRLTITLPDSSIVVRERHGAGNGISRQLHDAHEGAVKEAESDGLKRAAMTLGHPLGLALYDKERANVGVSEEKQQEELKAKQRASDESYTQKVIEKVSTFTTAKEANEYFPKLNDRLLAIKDGNPDLYQKIMDAFTKKTTETLEKESE
jgi:DNA repair and recombination protein RAD52